MGAIVQGDSWVSKWLVVSALKTFSVKDYHKWPQGRGSAIENVFTKNNGSSNDEFLRFFIGEHAPWRAACHAALNKNDNFFG